MIKMIVFDFRQSEEEFFKKHKLDNFNITFYKESLNEKTAAEIPDKVKNSASVISVFIESEITEAVLKNFKNLRLLTTRSTGVDHINLRACREKNIAVINVERYGSTSVTQYALGLMIAIVRNIPAAADYVKSDRKKCVDFTGRDLTKLTAGIVGTGATGAAMAKACAFLGMKVLGFDVIEKKELKLEYTDFETLVKKSDIITLHLPYTGDNLHMFSKREFGMMKRGAYFINTSRGELVETEDLYEAVENGHLGGAALDVLTCESYNFRCGELSENAQAQAGANEVSAFAQTPSESCTREIEAVKKLSKLPNVIITPHIAYETQDSVEFILEETFTGIMDFISGGNQNRVV